MFQRAWQVLASILIVQGLLSGRMCLRVKNLWVPGPIRNGTISSVILDCDYSLLDEDKDSFELKWYFRSDPVPIFQWVPPHPPQVLPRFSGHVNLDYEATSDPLTKHRALHLRRISTKLSGRYECRISSIHAEDFKAEHLLIYETPGFLDTRLTWVARDRLNATCIARKVYPQPNVGIFLATSVSKSDGKSYDISSEATSARSVSWSEVDLYEVAFSAEISFPVGLQVVGASSTKLTIDNEENTYEGKFVLQPEFTDVICRFELPGTNFVRRLRREVPSRDIFFSGDSEVSKASPHRVQGQEIIITCFLLAAMRSNF